MKLRFSISAQKDFSELEKDPSKARILKDVRKALGSVNKNFI